MNRTLSIYKVFLVAASVIMAASLFGCLPNSGQSDLKASRTLFDSIPNDPVPLALPEPPPSQPRALVTFAGDCTLSSIQDMSDFNRVYDSEGPEYFLGGVHEVFANDDYTVVNLEGPLTTATERIDKGEPPAYWFKSPPEYVQILTLGGVEACNLANNHTLDYGMQGLNQTRDVLTQAGLDYFIYDDGLVKEVNGIKIGFFGFAFDSNAYNIQVAMDNLWANGAEVIVAYFHDGVESEYYPNYSQTTAAHAAIDYGAAAVIMSHPHVIQGVEEYNGGFIAYSLGNFCYGGHTNPADKDSMLVQLEFLRTDAGISCTPTIIPCSISSTPGTNDYRPQVLTGAEGQRVLDKIRDLGQ
jgi:poly-gamma-glutamate synthesis protein (capsule biosynthesis protein)